MRRSERFPLLDRQVQLDRDPDLLGVYSVDTGYNFQMFLAVAPAWFSYVLVDVATCGMPTAFMFMMGVRLNLMTSCAAGKGDHIGER
jgi:hypothetical protein